MTNNKANRNLRIAFFMLGIGMAIVIALFTINLNATTHQGHQTAIALHDYERYGAEHRQVNNENFKNLRVVIKALSADAKRSCGEVEAVKKAIRVTINQAASSSTKPLTRQQKHQVEIVLGRFKPVNCNKLPDGVHLHT